MVACPTCLQTVAKPTRVCKWPCISTATLSYLITFVHLLQLMHTLICCQKNCVLGQQVINSICSSAAFCQYNMEQSIAVVPKSFSTRTLFASNCLQNEKRRTIQMLIRRLG
jgi:hypothetical protein